MIREAALMFKVSLGLFVAGEAIALAGLAPAPHSQLALVASLLLDRPSDAAYALGLFLAHVHVLHVMYRPARREYAATAIGGIALALLIAARDPLLVSRPARDLALLLCTGLGTASLAVFAWRALFTAGDRRREGVEMLAITGLLQLFSWIGATYLYFTATLHPKTFDAAGYQIDATLGFQPSAVLALIADAVPRFQTLLASAYNAILLGLVALLGLEATSGRRLPVRMLRLYLYSGLAAFALYHLCPIAGPRFLLEGYFPYEMPPPEVFGSEPVVIASNVPRNGMPSMHLATALTLWMNATYVGPKARAGFAVLAGLTGLATLGLGEHYLVDLAAGVPMAVTLQALCTHVLPWRTPARRAALYAFAMVLAWIAAVRFGAAVFLAVPGLAWVAILATLWASARLYGDLARESRFAL